MRKFNWQPVTQSSYGALLIEFDNGIKKVVFSHEDLINALVNNPAVDYTLTNITNSEDLEMLKLLYGK